MTNSRSNWSLAAVVLFAASCGSGGPSGDIGSAPAISADRIAAHVRFLSSDALEGRGPASRGEVLATEYIATQFDLAGAQPAGDDGSFFQSIPLTNVKTLPETTLRWQGAGAIPMTMVEDYVAHNLRQQEDTPIDAEAIFVGHGINAPEYNWNDYENIDVNGKIVVLFTNEPGTDDEAAFFGGRALTYYGRWAFKYEEARRQGALGAIIVHTAETAGYPWQVVRNSWGVPKPFVTLGPGDPPELAIAGWVTPETGQKILANTGKTLDELIEMSNTRGFEPIPLGIRLTGRMRSEVTPFATRNVLAKVEGSDPELRGEAILYTAHWDHVGVGFQVDGDGIYNGAVDNGSGCGVLLEMARAFAEMETKPARTVIFAAVGVEETGLLGSLYYAEHPPIPVGKTAVDLNYDGLLPLGRLASVALLGYERSTLKELVEQVAAEQGLAIEPDRHPELGYYYRSDHFSLARSGVPGFSIKPGMELEGQPSGTAEKAEQEHLANHYHQPSDEFDPAWDFGGIQQLAELGLEIGVRVANMEGLPTWQPGDEFLAAREASWVEAAPAGE